MGCRDGVFLTGDRKGTNLLKVAEELNQSWRNLLVIVAVVSSIEKRTAGTEEGSVVKR